MGWEGARRLGQAPRHSFTRGLGFPEMGTQKREKSAEDRSMLRLDFILRALGSHGQVLSRRGT